MKPMARRLKRLEARIVLRDVADRTDEDMVLELARSLCGIPMPSLKELTNCQRTDAEHQALSDQQRLALAIVSGEIEAINAVLKAGRDAISRNAKAREEVFVRVDEEWQHMRAAQLARGGKIGRQASWLFVDRAFGSSLADIEPRTSAMRR